MSTHSIVLRAGFYGLTGLLLLIITAQAWAITSVNVEGLFKNKAVLLIDGKRRIVRVGEKSPEGLTLISIRGEEAVIQINNKKRSYKLGERSSFRTDYASPQIPEVIIRRDDSGMYRTSGRINGTSVNFLVDTGATVVTLNSAHAKRLGINAAKEGQPTVVSTASSVEKAYRVSLDKVSVGGIVLHNIKAVVMSGRQPEIILLGMAFLGRLELQNKGSVMRLKKKW